MIRADALHAYVLTRSHACTNNCPHAYMRTRLHALTYMLTCLYAFTCLRAYMRAQLGALEYISLSLGLGLPRHRLDTTFPSTLISEFLDSWLRMTQAQTERRCQRVRQLSIHVCMVFILYTSCPVSTVMQN